MSNSSYPGWGGPPWGHQPKFVPFVPWTARYNPPPERTTLPDPVRDLYKREVYDWAKDFNDRLTGPAPLTEEDVRRIVRQEMAELIPVDVPDAPPEA